MCAGNHDVEGAEFKSDEENLEAWHQVRWPAPYPVSQHVKALCVALLTHRSAHLPPEVSSHS